MQRRRPKKPRKHTQRTSEKIEGGIVFTKNPQLKNNHLESASLFAAHISSIDAMPTFSRVFS